MFEISPHDVEIGFGGLRGRGQRKQDMAIERDLYLTLEEVFHGCIKKMKITRRVSYKLISDLLLFTCSTIILLLVPQFVS